ncbi:MAG: glycosyltransferase family A protein, partial [Dehalococcoidales bacterium]|nr:glycosyltransferase family A protein [Dehalococcoidales bacterium]
GAGKAPGMINASPTVSIVITTCNRANYLDRCLQSVLAQDFKDYEVLIMDDQSEDGTAEVINKYEALFHIGGCYRHLRNEPRLGYARSLNRGLREARGKYIAHLDDDDAWIDAGKLTRQVEFFKANPDHVLVGTGVTGIDENGKELFRGLLPEHDEQIRAEMLERNCFIHSSVMYRRDTAIAAGGYHEDKNPYQYEDYKLWLDLGTRGKLANLPAYSVNYTWKRMPIGRVFKTQVLPGVRTFWMVRQYRRQYPNYGRAVRRRLRTYLIVLLHKTSTVPPFNLAVKLLKSKCSGLWRKGNARA